ncbi:MAG: hypothetical protein F4137_00260 [Acidobacteria bacterium]|nr:hypothetical protein [Acidobacteriota bacterium]
MILDLATNQLTGNANLLHKLVSSQLLAGIFDGSDAARDSLGTSTLPEAGRSGDSRVLAFLSVTIASGRHARFFRAWKRPTRLTRASLTECARL